MKEKRMQYSQYALVIRYPICNMFSRLKCDYFLIPENWYRFSNDSISGMNQCNFKHPCMLCSFRLYTYWYVHCYPLNVLKILWYQFLNHSCILAIKEMSLITLTTERYTICYQLLILTIWYPLPNSITQADLWKT